MKPKLGALESDQSGFQFPFYSLPDSDNRQDPQPLCASAASPIDGLATVPISLDCERVDQINPYTHLVLSLALMRC